MYYKKPARAAELNSTAPWLAQYLHSIVWNILFLLAQGRLHEVLSPVNLKAVFSPTILGIMGTHTLMDPHMKALHARGFESCVACMLSQLPCLISCTELDRASIAAIMSSVGLVTSFFLKHLDSVLKSIAAAMEVVFTMVASAILFGTPLDVAGITAALLVAGGVALYAKPTAAKLPIAGTDEELEVLTKSTG